MKKGESHEFAFVYISALFAVRDTGVQPDGVGQAAAAMAAYFLIIRQSYPRNFRLPHLAFVQEIRLLSILHTSQYTLNGLMRCVVLV